ncbi:MAG TPA: polyprenyl synthetase family protein [Actinomycetota bacterium]|jgi:geranylgeranyl diphosphate synthase type I|nr:polyprenyl synthetase family protein [Actinomycetota bacterium]
MVKTRREASISRLVTDELLAFISAEREGLEREALPLLDELEALVEAGGKRLRPRFCYWGFVAGGGEPGAEIIRVGASLELLHTFAVIHDDVMDRSPLRRNRTSTFRALADLSAGVPHSGDPERFGMSAAILTGLLGFVLADRLFLTSGFPADVVLRAAERFDTMRTRAIAGQYLDLLSAHRGEADEATARRIGTLKSAGYSVVDPLVIGALCAGTEPRVVQALESYGGPIGEAFQLRDDVLGVFGDPSVTGKDRDGDIREGKQTVLLAKAKTMAGAAELSFLDAAVGDRHLPAEDADRVRGIIESTGALRATNELVAALVTEAKSHLDPNLIGTEASEALNELADAVAQRKD